MYGKYIKIGIVVLLVALAVYQFIIGNIGFGILLVLLAGFPVLFIFKNEYNLLALIFMKRGKFITAEKVLLKVKHPEAMPKSQEAYYYFLRGGLEAQKRQMRESERFYKRALATGLRMPTDQAMAKLNLAVGSISRRRKREAQIYLQEVKKLDKYKMLDEQVKMLKEQMKRI
ncbi:MAG: DUF2892 domain-containing protein [Bacteroidia bacterium]